MIQLFDSSHFSTFHTLSNDWQLLFISVCMKRLIIFYSEWSKKIPPLERRKITIFHSPASFIATFIAFLASANIMKVHRFSLRYLSIFQFLPIVSKENSMLHFLKFLCCTPFFLLNFPNDCFIWFILYIKSYIVVFLFFSLRYQKLLKFFKVFKPLVVFIGLTFLHKSLEY